MANKYFNKQVAESRKPYKHGSYVYAEPNPHVDILKYKTKDGKDDGERYRVEDSEMKVSKKKMGRPSMGRPALPMPPKKRPTKTPKIIEKKILDPRIRKQLEERFSKNKIKTKPESSIREKNQADYMKKHGKNPPRRKTLSVTNSYKKEVEGLK